MRMILNKHMKILAIIPARGGSKGIPEKNFRPIAGKPLIGWTIESALSAKRVDRVIVTTDSPEIMEIAKNFGAEVPFRRPTELAMDNTPGIEPILHATRWLIDHENYYPDFVVCLQPTSPFRIGSDIDNAVNLAIRKQAASVISVSQSNHHPNWMQIMDQEGKLDEFIPGGTSIGSRQEMEPVYELNGAIYLIKTDVLLEKKAFFVKDTYGYVMPGERSLDIDTLWDFHLAELIAEEGKWNPL